MQTFARVFLAARRVGRVRHERQRRQRHVQAKKEQQLEAKRRLQGGSAVQKARAAAGVPVGGRRGSGVDVFEMGAAGQSVHSMWPMGWLLCVEDSSGLKYWYNQRTEETRWDPPPQLAGARPKRSLASALKTHEDDSWAGREDYNTRTTKVTAGMYGRRQPRYTMCRLQKARKARPGSGGSKQAQAQGQRQAAAVRAVVDSGRSGGAVGQRRRPATAGTARPQPQARQRSAQSARPQSARPLTEREKQAHRQRRARTDALSLPKTLLRYGQLQQQWMARPQSAREPPVAQRPASAARRPQSARPPSAPKARAAQGTAPRGGRAFRPSSAPAARQVSHSSPARRPPSSAAADLRLEGPDGDDGQQQQLEEKLQARARARRGHPGQSPRVPQDVVKPRPPSANRREAELAAVAEAEQREGLGAIEEAAAKLTPRGSPLVN